MAKSYSVSNEWFKQTTEKLENEYKDKMDDPAKAQEYYEKLNLPITREKQICDALVMSLIQLEN